MYASRLGRREHRDAPHGHLGETVAVHVAQQVVRGEEPAVALDHQRRHEVVPEAEQVAVVVRSATGEGHVAGALAPLVVGVGEEGPQGARIGDSGVEGVHDLVEIHHHRRQALRPPHVGQSLGGVAPGGGRDHQIVGAVAGRGERRGAPGPARGDAGGDGGGGEVLARRRGHEAHLEAAGSVGAHRRAGDPARLEGALDVEHLEARAGETGDGHPRVAASREREGVPGGAEDPRIGEVEGVQIEDAVGSAGAGEGGDVHLIAALPQDPRGDGEHRLPGRDPRPARLAERRAVDRHLGPVLAGDAARRRSLEIDGQRAAAGPGQPRGVQGVGPVAEGGIAALQEVPVPVVRVGIGREDGRREKVALGVAELREDAARSGRRHAGGRRLHEQPGRLLQPVDADGGVQAVRGLAIEVDPRRIVLAARRRGGVRIPGYRLAAAGEGDPPLAIALPASSAVRPSQEPRLETAR